jgi:PAS domain S-box-containing protein
MKYPPPLKESENGSMIDSLRKNSWRISLAGALLWSASILGIGMYNISKHREHALENIRIEAEAIIDNSINIIYCISSHGELYQKNNTSTAQIDNYTLKTTEGDILTLFSPFKGTKKDDDKRIKISLISPSPVNETNRATEWEKKGLETILTEDEHFSRIRPLKGGVEYTIIKPLITEENCIRCHPSYTTGSINGAIKTIIKVDKKEYYLGENTIISLYSILWLLGIGAIGIGNYSMSRLIKKHENTQNELIDIKEFYKGIMNSLNDLITVQNKELKVVYSNWKRRQDANGFFDPTKDKCYERYARKTKPCEDCPALITLNTGKPIKTEKYFPDIDRWKIISTYPLRTENQDIEFIIEHVQDITKRKKGEEKLAKLKNEKEKIFKSMQIGLVYLKGGRYVHETNPFLEKMLGYSKDEIIGKSVEMFHLDTEHFQRFGNMYYNHLTKDRLLQIEYPLRHKDGHLIWARLSGIALNKDNLDEGVIWTVDDITEEKKTERLREDTERILQHDIRSPLTGIIGATRIIIEEEAPDSVKKMAEAINSSAQKIIRKLTHSLDIFKMEEGTYKARYEAFNLESMIESLKTEYFSRYSEKIIINFEYSEQLDKRGVYSYLGEEMHLRSAFANLIQNAIEASENRFIRIDVTGEKEMYLFDIFNKGKIPEEIQSRMFEKYMTFGKDQGTGLGVYSAKLIIENHKGTISFNSSEKGTHTYVRLPKNSFDI